MSRAWLEVIWYLTALAPTIRPFILGPSADSAPSTQDTALLISVDYVRTRKSEALVRLE